MGSLKLSTGKRGKNGKKKKRSVQVITRGVRRRAEGSKARKKSRIAKPTQKQTRHVEKTRTDRKKKEDVDVGLTPSYSRGAAAIRRLKEARERQQAASRFRKQIVRVNQPETGHFLGSFSRGMTPILTAAHYVKMPKDYQGYWFCSEVDCGMCRHTPLKQTNQVLFEWWSHSRYHMIETGGDSRPKFENCTLEEDGDCYFCNSGNKAKETGIRWLPLSSKWAQSILALHEKSRVYCYECARHGDLNVVRTIGYICPLCEEEATGYHPKVNDSYRCPHCDFVSLPFEIVECPECGDDTRRVSLNDYRVQISKSGSGQGVSYNFERVGNPKEFNYPVRCSSKTKDGKYCRGYVHANSETVEELECPECGEVIVEEGGAKPIDWDAVIQSRMMSEQEVLNRLVPRGHRDPSAGATRYANEQGLSDDPEPF